MVLASLTQDNPMMGAIYLMGVTTGLRISDILSLKTSQFKQILTVKAKKTDKIQQFKLPDCVFGFMEVYADYRADDDTDDRLFPVSRQTVWRYFKRAGAKMDIPVSCHDMRRIFAWNVLRVSGCLRVVQNALGHRFASVTVLYLVGAILWVAKNYLEPITFLPAETK